MTSKEAYRSLAAPQYDERQARRGRIASWLVGTFVVLVITMTMGSVIYALAPVDGYLHQMVDAVWAQFNYFGGARPTR